MTCGSKLVHVGYIEDNPAYSPSTGKRYEPMELWQCPNWRWWKAPFVYHERMKRNGGFTSGFGLTV